jgi:hypothetical protein
VSKQITSALVLAVLAAATITAVASASATSASLRANLDAHHVVTPKNKPWTPPATVAKARGTLTGTFGGANGRTLNWRITYSGVGSNPLKITDVHYGPAKKFGPILFRLCGNCKSGQHGTKKLTAFQLKEIKAGMAWVTVITGKYPNGVIRGQIHYSS